MNNQVNEMQFFIDQAQNDLISFCVFTDLAKNNPRKAYNPKSFHIKIAEQFERLYKGEINKLILSVPPQHGKSTLTSINFPARILGKDPTLQIALASYGANLSEGFSQRCRDLIRQPEYKAIFGDILKEDSQAKHERYTKQNGRYTAVGIGGPLTGKPVDIMIIDDPIKDMEEANSKLIKDKIWDWYNSVALSRLHIKSKQIVIMTRWNEDDLVGRIIEANPEGREIMNIPVYDGNNEPIRPERFPKELIEEKRKNDEYVFQSLYMGDPVPEGGQIFKKEYFELYDISEIRHDGKYLKPLEIITFIDPAISQKQEADNTAIVTVGLDRTNNFIYVIDIERGKFLPDEIVNLVFQKVLEFAPDKVGIESNQYQKMLYLELQKQMRIRDRFFPLEAVMTMGEKEAKIKTVLHPRYSNHSILHQKHGKNVGELESELLKFPNGKHDDVIDCLAMALKMLGTANGREKAVQGDWFGEDKQRQPSLQRELNKNNINQSYIQAEW